MTLKDLATEVLAVLDLQKTYFRTRDTNDQNAAKTAETKLRKTCRDILAGTSGEGSDLFSAAPNGP